MEIKLSEQKTAIRNSKSGGEVAERVEAVNSSKASKTDLRYWQGRVFHEAFTREGTRIVSPEFSARMQFRGRRETFALRTANRMAAAARAKEIYLNLVSAGWDVTLAKWKPAVHSVVTPTRVCTLGEFIEAVKVSSTVKPKTLEGYCKALRMIVAQVAGVPSGRERFDYRTGGHQRWLGSVHAVGLDVLGPTKVQAWKAGFLRAAGADPVSQKTARVSVNAFLRNAKALFSPNLLKFLDGLKLPEPLPFVGVAFEKPGSLRYRSTIEPEKLLAEAREELAVAHPEQFKIFLLALLAGLRRNEIDKLQWSALDFARGVIRIEATEFFQPKSEDSAGDVEVNPRVLELLQSYRPAMRGVFVIQSDNAPRPAATFNHYRAEKEFEALNRWLRGKGVTGRAPLHVLRKEFGSLMNEEFGIYAASRALRHGRLEVTSAYYTDRKSRKTLSLGDQLDVRN